VSRLNRSTPSNAGLIKPGVGIFTPSSAVVLLASAGVVLRLWAYLSNNSLWLDEAALVRNVIDRSPLELLGPLDYAQVAPQGFLLVEKTIVSLLGNSEWTLRLFPLGCGLCALALFSRLAAGTLTGWAVPYAVGLFAIGAPLVDFSAQVKQYSSDILATVVVLWAVLWHGGRPFSVRRAAGLAAVGAVVVWFSQPAVFVLIGAGGALAVSALRERRGEAFRTLIVVGGAWSASAAGATAVALRSVTATDREYLHWYWTGSVGFMPTWSGAWPDLLWIWDRFVLMFGVFGGARQTNGGLGYPWSPLFVVVMTVGYVALWRSRRETALMLLLPVLATLAAAVLQLYPFTGRVVSFLLPMLLLATAAGVADTLRRLPKRLPLAAPAFLAVSVGSPLYAMARSLPPERMQHLRPVMAHLAERREPGDAVYVYYGGAQAFLYYAPRFGLDLDGVSLGRCSMVDPRVYLKDVDRWRGRPRVWIVGTHARRDAAELKAIVAYLNTIGTRQDLLEVRSSTNSPSNGAYAFLFDLSDQTRLSSSSADTYPVPAPSEDAGMRRWGCYGPVQASGRL
jgi:hypothetical protein